MVKRLISAMKAKGWVIYTDPYRLNILGIRSDSVQANSFDDVIHVFFKDDRKRWILFSWKATTDPGTYWLTSPMHPRGTAILKQGQYHSYGIAKHRKRYDALCQINGEVTVIRDYNRDSILDFDNGHQSKGWYGINLHKASGHGEKKEINRDSAGCQVLAREQDFNRFMDLCWMHLRIHGNQFSYSLLDNRALRRTKIRRTAIGAGLAFAAVAAGLMAYNFTSE